MSAGRKALCFVASLSLVAMLFLYVVTPRRPLAPDVGIRLIDHPPPGWRKAAYSPAMQEAVNEYLWGMSILERADPIDVELARRLFADAMTRGLPHARYGLACAIYRTRDKSHYREALYLMEYAASENVLEAKVGAASFYLSGIGARPDADMAVLRYVEALRFRLAPPEEASDPIYLYKSNSVVAGIAFKSGETNGICNPPISADQIEEKRRDWWKLLIFPRLLDSWRTANIGGE